MLLMLLVLLACLIIGDLFIHALDACLLLTYSIVRDVFIHALDVCLPKNYGKKDGGTR